MLGFGLAMDAFSVSLADGLAHADMKRGKMLTVAGAFAIFQGVMPLIGWFFVTRLSNVFNVIEPYIPWAALVLLVLIGGKMLYEGLFCTCKESGTERCGCSSELTLGAIFIQGIATSIDALSVGLTIAELNFTSALLEAGIIALLTLLICYAGIIIGKKFGTRLSGKASVLGGTVLIAIGFKIFFFG